MKRYLAALVAVAAVLVAAPARASEPLPRPARNDPSVITTAGTYDQEQADANRATYLALQDYADEQDANWRIMVRGLNDNIAVLLDANSTKAGQVTSLWSIVAARDKALADKDAALQRRVEKIAELRAIIRDLRD